MLGNELGQRVVAERGAPDGPKEDRLGLTAVLFQPGTEHSDAATGERHAAFLAALAPDPHVGAFGELDVFDEQPDHLGGPEPALAGDAQERVITAPVPGALVGSLEEGVDLGRREVADHVASGALLGNGKHPGDELGVLGRRNDDEPEEAPQGGQADVPRGNTVVALLFQVVQEGGHHLAPRRRRTRARTVTCGRGPTRSARRGGPCRGS